MEKKHFDIAVNFQSAQSEIFDHTLIGQFVGWINLRLSSWTGQIVAVSQMKRDQNDHGAIDLEAPAYSGRGHCNCQTGVSQIKNISK